MLAGNPQHAASGDAKALTSALAPVASPKLDVLRTVAVLTVMLSHILFSSRAAGSTGRVGVLFFFVHTCLVLMFSLERRHRVTGRHRLFTTFMLRRVLRIYPLSIVVVLAVWLFSIPAYVFPNGNVYHLVTDPLGLLANLLLVQDVVLSAGGGVFIGVLWTLPIELEMYLLLPAIFLLVRWVSSVRLMLLAWCGAAVFALGMIRFVFSERGRVIATFDWGWLALPRVIEFLPCFLAGVVAWLLWRRVPARLPFITLPVLLFGIIAFWFALAHLSAPGSVRLVFGMLACLAVGLLLPVVREPQIRLVRAPCATVARYSYGIYLVHVPCIWLGFGVLNGQPIAVQWLVTFAATFFVSFALYHLVEQPGIRLGTRLAQRWSRPPARSLEMPLGPQPAAVAREVAE